MNMATVLPVPLHVLDSIGYATTVMTGAVVVSGSHGGMSAARYAAEVRPRLAVFNDAGRGLDDAGVSGLAWLDGYGVAACTVGHDTARIGEASSTLSTGIVTQVNLAAAALGVLVGMHCTDAVRVAGGEIPA